MKLSVLAFAFLISIFGSTTALAMPSDSDPITIRVEQYPRPPYSGASYFIYEQDGYVICTKLSVCNKYNDCTTTYFDGVLKQFQDLQTGAPYSTTAPIEIRTEKLKGHVCLTKFNLI